MKKVLSVILALVMLVSLTLTGCSSSKDKDTATTTDKSTTENGAEGEESKSAENTNATEEPYNVVMSFLYIAEVPGEIAEVEAAINEITLEKINCTVTLMPVAASEQNAKFSLWLSNGEKVDVMSMFIGMDMGVCVANQSLVVLDDLMEENAPYLSSLDEVYLSGAVYEGSLYGIPVMQRSYGTAGAIAVRTDIMNEVGLDYGQNEMVTYEQLDEMFALVHEKYPDMITLGAGKALTETKSQQFINKDGLQTFGDASGVLMNAGVGTTEIVNIFETEEYREYLDWMRSWNLAGYISKDAATTTDEPLSDWLKSGRSFSAFTNIEPGKAESTTEGTGHDITVLQLTELSVSGGSYAAAPWVIPITCERPDKALQFLDLMYESKELVNLIQYGIEGKHYEKTDDEMIINLFEDRAYKNDLGLYGNKMQVYMAAPADSSVYEESLAQTEKAKERTSIAAGYKFISDGVSTELTAINNVFNEYLSSLEYGFVDIDTVLPQFLKALEDAGINEVIAENQVQFDKWLESKENE